MNRPRAATLLIPAMLALTACGTQPKAPPTPPQGPPPAWLTPRSREEPLRLPASMGTARQAAMVVAMMPPIRDGFTRRQIMLFQVLYTAAHDSVAGEATQYVLLVPPADGLPAGLAVDDREFCLRVLAGLVKWSAAVAWDAPDPPPDPDRAVHFPGTREPASRLGIRFLPPIDLSGDVVRVEISDETGRVGGSRQAVTVTWDGEQWALEFDPARMVW